MQNADTSSEFIPHQRACMANGMHRIEPPSLPSPRICHKYPEHVTHRHNTEQPPFAEIHSFRDESCAHNMSKRRLATVRSKIRRTTSRPTQSVDHSSEIRRRTRTVHQIAAIDKHVAATVHQKISI